MTRAVQAIESHVEKTARSASRWSWISRAIFAVLILATVAFGTYLAAANIDARVERIELIQQLDEERAKVDALYEQLQALGEDPVVEPGKSTPGEAGPTGPAGPQGVPGLDGRTPTAAEVLAAVNAYCASVGGCRGDDGTPGSNGTDGASGPAGPAGPPGAPGTNGADGVSVTGVSCVLRDDLSTAFRFTFSNGATADVAGACLP